MSDLSGERSATSMPRVTGRLRADAGTMTILTVGVLVVILMVIGVGVAVTGVHLARNELQAMADGASLAASQGFEEAAIYGGADGSGSAPAPTEHAAQELAEAYLERYPIRTDRLRAVAIREVEVAPDGTVRVTLDAACDPPLIGWFTERTAGGVPLSAAGDARAR